MKKLNGIARNGWQREITCDNLNLLVVIVLSTLTRIHLLIKSILRLCHGEYCSSSAQFLTAKQFYYAQKRRTHFVADEFLCRTFTRQCQFTNSIFHIVNTIISMANENVVFIHWSEHNVLSFAAVSLQHTVGQPWQFGLTVKLTEHFEILELNFVHNWHMSVNCIWFRFRLLKNGSAKIQFNCCGVRKSRYRN